MLHWGIASGTGTGTGTGTVRNLASLGFNELDRVYRVWSSGGGSDAGTTTPGRWGSALDSARLGP
ncbi:MAG: hypothetical protein HY791_18855 [Deltaproteobacteria bacterium]|nr:hypothetical protein [Deltaproteobacteria bacterium]